MSLELERLFLACTLPPGHTTVFQQALPDKVWKWQWSPLVERDSYVLTLYDRALRILGSIEVPSRDILVDPDEVLRMLLSWVRLVVTVPPA